MYRYFIILFAFSLFTSCSEEPEDLCLDVFCENNGICLDGKCDCPDGYIGNECSKVDVAKVQQLLNEGVSPINLYNGGVGLDDLYGKSFGGGVLFYLDTMNGTGLIASNMDLGPSEWGCMGTSIPALSNDLFEGGVNTELIVQNCVEANIAAKLCYEHVENGFDDWVLPSYFELAKMTGNFFTGNDLYNHHYWCSTEATSTKSWGTLFTSGGFGIGDHNKNELLNIRAIRYF